MAGRLTVQKRARITERYKVWKSIVQVKIAWRTIKERHAQIDPEVIKNCHAKLMTTGSVTQNPNECLNKVMWSRCARKVWIGYKTVQQAVYAAVAHFNNGYISYVKIMQELGINRGHFCLSFCQKLDSSRISKSKQRSSAAAKQRRKTLRATKKGLQDKKQTEEGITYAKNKFLMCQMMLKYISKPINLL